MLTFNRPRSPRQEKLVAGRYILLEEIGRGRFGSVHRAADREKGADAALKVGLDETDRSYARKIIANEAAALGKVSHGGVVGLRGIGESEAGPFLAMEYVEGMNMMHYLHRRSLALSSKIRIISGILDGLEALHGKGVVHRDIKPKNIMIGPDGRASLIDLGFSRIEGEKDLTEGFRKRFGSPIYSPPEDMRGNGDPRIDIYSAGMVLFELMMERSRFYFLNALRLAELRAGFYNQLRAETRIPAGIREVISCATELNPARRFMSAFAMREAIEASIQ